MRRLTQLICALVALAVLGACGSSESTQGAFYKTELFEEIKTVVKARRAPPPQPTVLTRALLDTLDAPHLEVKIEKDDAVGFVLPQLVRRDELPGEIVTWRAADNATITLRDGVLIATRGMTGYNLIAASTLVEEGGAQGPSTSGPRRYTLRIGNEKQQSFSFACDLVSLGPKSLEIVELTYATTHLQERCASAEGEIVNDYWVDSKTGRVWQSRQWAGPSIGYLTIRQLTI